MAKKRIIIPLKELSDVLKDSGVLGDQPGFEEERTPDGLISVMDNHIYFYADVTPLTSLRLKNIMIKLRNESLCESIVKGKDPDPVHIHINSPGGLITSGFMLYDTITAVKSKIPVWTHIEGQGSSAATLFSIAGTKRFITPTSFMLIHEMRSFIFGSMKEISEEYKNLLRFEEKYLNIYMAHSNFESRDALKAFLERDTVLNAEDALAKNLVDEISTEVF